MTTGPLPPAAARARAVHRAVAELRRGVPVLLHGGGEALLGERVGVVAEHFCYPKAVAGSAEAEAAVKARFTTAVLAGTRPNPVGSDLHRLRRSPVQRSDGPVDFQRKATGGMHLEDDVRAGGPA